MSIEKTELKVRIDKWLWAARFYKTRSLAKQNVEGGKVHYDGQRIKASKIVEVGQTLRLRIGLEEKTITILAVSDKRLSAPLAQALYEESSESIEKRTAEAQNRKDMNASILAPQKRPDKKQRRDILKTKHSY
ncbi:ribosome-associated heat shock protein Hsp15 [Marinicellulosiphila megalodicopiae]|uniref:ribosome-associated heat shock protein Hsp15 n=1 Tax=Marinicellulosiphila megalodicopiae TaxID=2724896 RepID=UPI003BB2184D